MTEKRVNFILLNLALLPFVVLGLEIIVVLVESLVYGNMDFNLWSFQAVILHWVYTIIVWCTGLFLLCLLSKKIGYSIFAAKDKPKIKNWIIIGIILIITAIGSYIAWKMHFKPVLEYNGFINKYGSIGIVAFVFQYLYYVVESCLFLAIVVFGQEFGERVFKKIKIPWGGILCGLTWGLGHIITQDLFTGFYAFFGAILYGVVYSQMQKNIKFAYIIIAIMFII